MPNVNDIHQAIVNAALQDAAGLASVNQLGTPFTDRFNGFSHTFQSAIYTYFYGQSVATLLGDAKEESVSPADGRGGLADSARDQFNNALGRQIGQWARDNGLSLSDLRKTLVYSYQTEQSFNNINIVELNRGIDQSTYGTTKIPVRWNDATQRWDGLPVPQWQPPTTPAQWAALNNNSAGSVQSTGLGIPAWASAAHSVIEFIAVTTAINFNGTQNENQAEGDFYRDFINRAEEAAGDAARTAGDWIRKTWDSIFPKPDPLVLDLDGHGVLLTALGTTNAHFDFGGDGAAELTGWVSPGDALLARDINGDGLINNGSELFGSSQQNGFAALAVFDANGDGRINASDPIFAQLRAWRDANQDGVSQAGELLTMAQAGIASINLAANGAAADWAGNSVLAAGTFTLTSAAPIQLAQLNAGLTLAAGDFVFV